MSEINLILKDNNMNFASSSESSLIEEWKKESARGVNSLWSSDAQNYLSKYEPAKVSERSEGGVEEDDHTIHY